MFLFLRAGFAAAGLQLAAVTTLTALVLAARSPVIDWSTPRSDIDINRFSTSPILIFAYLVMAAGLAMTNTRSVGQTAACIRRASGLMSRSRPKRASKALLIQSASSAAMFAVVALRVPPGLVVEAGRALGCDCAGSLIWASVMSIGVACFGATAHAAYKAL